jgi:hypothetical protein
MDAATTMLLVQVLLQYGPEAVRQILSIFKKADPTVEDWEALLAIVDTPLHK